MEEQYLQERLTKLEKKERIYHLIMAKALSAIILSCLNLFGIPKQDIIRTKGIIVVDEDNRERILIGMPVPDTKGRIRDDLCNGLINDNTGARYSTFRLDADSPRWEVYNKDDKIIYDALKNLKRK